MKKAYICSPYRAASEEELDRNIEYAQELTRRAIDAGLAPITTHLYITRCTNENNAKERAAGLAVGLEWVGACDVLIVGKRYGISEGMAGEIQKARYLGIQVIDAKDLAEFAKKEEEAERIAALGGYLPEQAAPGLLPHEAEIQAEAIRGLEVQVETARKEAEVYRGLYNRLLDEVIAAARVV